MPSALEENTYTFTAADQWKIKFENSVKFKTAWIQNINIYDLNDDTVFWIAEATISEETVIQDIDISILSPENWLTIWEDSINVSWKTKKNHQIKIILNSKDEIDTTSNDDWTFEILIENLIDWENTIKAQVLDADLNIIWESNEVSLKYDMSNLSIKNVSVTPEEVDSENSFEVEVLSNPNLMEVTIIIDDVVSILEETSSWLYAAKVFAPKESGIFKIDVKIKDELGREKLELGASSITVNEIVLEAADEKEKIIEEEVVEEVVMKDDWKKELKITGLKLVELKTKSILTWDKLEEAESYNIYKKINKWELELVDNVSDSIFEVEIVWDEIKYDYFAVKAIAKTLSWEIYEWSLSDATKVKTWPELLILILLSLFIWWFILIIKQKKA